MGLDFRSSNHVFNYYLKLPFFHHGKKLNFTLSVILIYAFLIYFYLLNFFFRLKKVNSLNPQKIIVFDLNRPDLFDILKRSNQIDYSETFCRLNKKSMKILFQGKKISNSKHPKFFQTVDSVKIVLRKLDLKHSLNLRQIKYLSKSIFQMNFVNENFPSSKKEVLSFGTFNFPGIFLHNIIFQNRIEFNSIQHGYVFTNPSKLLELRWGSPNIGSKIYLWNKSFIEKSKIEFSSTPFDEPEYEILNIQNKEIPKEKKSNKEFRKVFLYLTPKIDKSEFSDFKIFVNECLKYNVIPVVSIHPSKRNSLRGLFAYFMSLGRLMKFAPLTSSSIESEKKDSNFFFSNGSTAIYWDYIDGKGVGFFSSVKEETSKYTFSDVKINGSEELSDFLKLKRNANV